MADDENEFKPEDYKDLPIPDNFIGVDSWEDIPEPQRTLLRHLAEAAVEATMTHEAEAHAAQRFFDELNVDQLVVLSGLFNDIAAEGNGRLAAYYQGVTRAILHVKFSVCPTCGVDHEKEAMEGLMGDGGGDG